MYVVPYSCSKAGARQPFLLPTKYGKLIFAFKTADGALGPFIELCDSILAEGYSMETTLIMESTDERLRASIASEISSATQFAVIIEGSPEFDQLIDEIAEGKIWS